MFRPSHESLLIQNAEINRLELPRIQNDTELEALKADGSLLEIHSGESCRFEPSLDPSRRYLPSVDAAISWMISARPTTTAFMHRFR